MERIDEACQSLVNGVEGAVACGVVDLESGIVLGSHGAVESAALGETLAAVCLELFVGRRAAEIASALVTSTKKESRPFFDEVQVASGRYYHLGKTMNHGKTAVLLVTRKDVNVGLGWAQVKTAAAALESRVP